MTIKLVAIDLDGTLLNEEHKISPEVKQAIQAARQAGVKNRDLHRTSFPRRHSLFERTGPER